MPSNDGSNTVKPGERASQEQLVLELIGGNATLPQPSRIDDPNREAVTGGRLKDLKTRAGKHCTCGSEVAASCGSVEKEASDD